jgi:lipopolysaccharide heptosyltransferase II
MVMAQSLFKVLQQNHPGCHIEVIAPGWTLSLLERMPEVVASITMPLGHGQFALKVRMDLGRQLQSQHFDQAIILPNSWKSALLPFFAKIPLRTGYLGECRWGLLNDARKLDKKKLTMTVQRFVALGFAQGHKIPVEFPVPELTIDPEKQTFVVGKFNLQVQGKILAICPGAEFGPSKCWPAEYYAQVARRKITQGWQVWLFGSQKDKPVAEKIGQLTEGQCLDLCGLTTLAEAVDIMSLVDTVVTNDSGLMHVGAALKKNIIAIYGSSDPKFTPPLAAKVRIISRELSCSPCFKRECPLNHLHCLTEITPDYVEQEIDALS